MLELSENAKAILLLTAPLLTGGPAVSAELLTPSEYRKLARVLRDEQSQPADLVLPAADALVRQCAVVVDEARLRSLLARGFLLSQAVERWCSRGIWVVSRADASYPRRLKNALREDAPPLLYGCGDWTLLNRGGLAVVGSRNADSDALAFAQSVGRLAARAGALIVSGGAKGIDQAAMSGAIEADGQGVAVLSDSLDRAALNRDNRAALVSSSLVLISPFDPAAAFNVGHAMQRNKLIYALSDAALVVRSDYNKGGTWAGAVEQLDRLRLVPVYVVPGGKSADAMSALLRKGAQAWPTALDATGLSALLAEPPRMSAVAAQEAAGLFDVSSIVVANADPMPGRIQGDEASPVIIEAEIDSPSGNDAPMVSGDASKPASAERIDPAEILFSGARRAMLQVLSVPTKEADLAETLNISKAQCKEWLKRLLDEGQIEKSKKPSGYVVKRLGLFG